MSACCFCPCACACLTYNPVLPHTTPHAQAFAQGNIIHEQLLGAYERELSATWLEIDSSGRERRVSRLDDFTSQVRGGAAGARRDERRAKPVVLVQALL